VDINGPVILGRLALPDLFEDLFPGKYFTRLCRHQVQQLEFLTRNRYRLLVEIHGISLTINDQIVFAIGKLRPSVCRKVKSGTQPFEYDLRVQRPADKVVCPCIKGRDFLPAFIAMTQDDDTKIAVLMSRFDGKA